MKTNIFGRKMKGGTTFYYVLKMSFMWHSGKHNLQSRFCFRVKGSLEQSLMEEMEDPRSYERVDTGDAYAESGLPLSSDSVKGNFNTK